MPIPKRHHYLPAAYLAGFTRGRTADSEFVVYDREENTYRIQTPKNTGVQNHYYSMETIHGERSTRAEECLSQVEGIAMPLIRQLETRGRVTVPDKLNLAVFVALLFTRVPRYERAIREMTNAVYKHTHEIAFATVERTEYWIRRHEEKTGQKVDVTPEQLRDYVQAGEYDVVPHQNTVVRNMFDSASKFSLLIAQMTWLVAIAPVETSFITSDAPFVITPPERWHGPFGFGTPGATTLIPLSQQVCLCIGGEASVVAYRNIPKSEVRQVNIAVAQNCERYLIARDESLLKNIVAKSRTANLKPRTRAPFRRRPGA